MIFFPYLRVVFLGREWKNLRQGEGSLCHQNLPDKAAMEAEIWPDKAELEKIHSGNPSLSPVPLCADRTQKPQETHPESFWIIFFCQMIKASGHEVSLIKWLIALLTSTWSRHLHVTMIHLHTSILLRHEHLCNSHYFLWVSEGQDCRTVLKKSGIKRH